MLIYSKVASTLWLQTQFGMIFYPLEIKIQYYYHIWTVFINKNFLSNLHFCKAKFFSTLRICNGAQMVHYNMKIDLEKVF